MESHKVEWKWNFGSGKRARRLAGCRVVYPFWLAGRLAVNATVTAAYPLDWSVLCLRRALFLRGSFEAFCLSAFRSTITSSFLLPRDELCWWLLIPARALTFHFPHLYLNGWSYKVICLWPRYESRSNAINTFGCYKSIRNIQPICTFPYYLISCKVICGASVRFH